MGAFSSALQQAQDGAIGCSRCDSLLRLRRAVGAEPWVRRRRLSHCRTACCQALPRPRQVMFELGAQCEVSHPTVRVHVLPSPDPARVCLDRPVGAQVTRLGERDVGLGLELTQPPVLTKRWSSPLPVRLGRQFEQLASDCLVSLPVLTSLLAQLLATGRARRPLPLRLLQAVASEIPRCFAPDLAADVLRLGAAGRPAPCADVGAV